MLTGRWLVDAVPRATRATAVSERDGQHSQAWFEPGRSPGDDAGNERRFTLVERVQSYDANWPTARTFSTRTYAASAATTAAEGSHARWDASTESSNARARAGAGWTGAEQEA